VGRSITGRRQAFELQCRDLSARVESLVEFDDAHLKAQREKVERFRMRLGAGATWDRVLSKVGAWVQETAATSESGAFVTRTGRFRMKSPSVSDWPQIVETVSSLESIPGIGISQLELKSSGSATQRSLDFVGMVVVVQMARAQK